MIGPEIYLTEPVPIWIILSLFGVLVSGLVVLIWGRKIPRNGDWVIGVAHLSFLVAVGLNISSTYQLGSSGWLRGWVWPRNELGSISIGIIRDYLGLVLSGISALVSVLLVANGGLFNEEPRRERVFAAAGFASTGLALTWMSLTPWLAFIGLASTVFGGFVCLGSRWSSDSEADLASRFAREKVWGILLSLLGACALAGSGVSLVSDGVINWSFGVLGYVGVLLFVVGLFIQLQPFPFLGLTVTASEIAPPARLMFANVFPAWAAFAVFTRFEDQFRSIGIFPHLGWFAVGSALISAFSGLLQKDWRQGLGVWLSAINSVALAALAFSGAWAGIAVSVSGGLAVAAMSSFGFLIRKNEKPSNDSKDKGIWIRIGCITSAAVGSGLIGFISAGGNIRWILAGFSTNTSAAALFTFVSFLLALLLWKLMWNIIHSGKSVYSNYFSVLIPFVFLLFSLGVFWSGSLTGGTLPGDPDKVARSIFDIFFINDNSLTEVGLVAVWLHWGALVIAFVAAYWLAGKQDRFLRLHTAFPSAASFLAQGYRVDALIRPPLALAIWIGRSTEGLIDRKIWNFWLPKSLNWMARVTGGAMAESDASISKFLAKTLSRGIEVPVKILQLIQSGNVQWYLFFAVASGIAILVHFLRF